MASRRWGGTLTWLGIPALALAVVPSLGAPFSMPKRAVLGALAVAALGFAGWTRLREVRLAPVLAVAGLGALSSVSGGLARPAALGELLAACALCFGLAALRPTPNEVLTPLAWTGAVLALWAVAQAIGFEPLRLLGWRPVVEGERMRIHGGLGNPDFLAAFLLPAACATAVLVRTGPTRVVRWLAIGALVAEGAALFLTRSFGTALALGGVGILLLLAPRRARLKGLALCALGLTVVLAGASGRSLGSRLEGRLYLVRVAAPHLWDAPLLGRGPGSVATLWPAWETEHWRSAASPAERPFAAPQDHLHDDGLEAALELGLLGLAALLAWAALAVRAGLQRRQEPEALALTCALVALLARALVDFPLHRPAELGLFAILTAVLLSNPEESSCVASAPLPSPSV